MKIIRKLIYASIVLLLLVSGCSDILTTAGNDTEEYLGSKVVTETTLYPSGALCGEEGILGPGAVYRIALPEGWQMFPEGSKHLILYSHGYVTPGTNFEETAEYQIVAENIAAFTQMGFAVAFSYYSDSGWAVKDGTIRTRQLNDYFTESIGTPDMTYLFGVSEGALIVVKLAEQNPDLFNGALAVAGPIGGAEAEFHYIMDVRLAFDEFFKEQLRDAAMAEVSFEAVSLASALGYDLTSGQTLGDSSVFDVFPGELLSIYESNSIFVATYATLLASMMVDPYLLIPTDSAMAMSTVAVNGNPLFAFDFWQANPDYFIQEFSIFVATALWYNIYGTDDLLEKTHGIIPVDNSEDLYTYLDEMVPLFFDVERFSSEPSAENYLSNYYEPVGDLMIPVVTLHTTRDPAVPYFHEEAYAEVAAGGMLYQTTIQGFGHGFLMNPDGSINIPASLEALLEALAMLQYMVAASAP